MAQKNEITIRVSSPILYIDDESASPDISGQNSLNSLTVVNKKTQNTSPDTSLMPSLIAPIAKNETTLEEIGHSRQYQLTIRDENTVINIQTIKPSKKPAIDKDDIYEFIQEGIQKIFQTPEKADIEKSLEDDTLSSVKKTVISKRGNWKILSKATLQKQTLREEERYPSIVLLKDPPEGEPVEENYPKMIMTGKENNDLLKRKVASRSKSRFSVLSTSFSDLNLEKQRLDVKKSHLEREKRSLSEARAGLEKGKQEIEKEKQILARSKSFLMHDQDMLQEKKQILRDGKGASQGTGNSLLKKEKLCLELEKQLLEDEKSIITKELKIIDKEKGILEEEQNILGDEKHVLAEEKIILGKEVMLEKQTSLNGKQTLSPDSVFNQPDELLSEIENVFQQASEISNNNCEMHQQRPEFRSSPFSALSHCSNKWSSCNLQSVYPVYIPVYNIHRPYSSYHSCCQGTLKQSKSIQTQTEDLSSSEQISCAAPELEDLSSLSFGLIFPRVVMSMNNVSEKRPDIANSQLQAVTREIKTDPDVKEPQIKRQALKKVARPTKKTAANKLQLPARDLTFKAASSIFEHSPPSIPETKLEEPRISTLTSETQGKDDTPGISDDIISIETFHFGNSDDFYTNEAVFPEGPEDKPETNTDISRPQIKPLTNIGYDMFEKLTKLSLGRDFPPENPPPTDNNVKCGSNFSVNLNLNVRCGDVQLTLPGNIIVHVKPNAKPYDRNAWRHARKGAIELTQEEGGKVLVERADLWYTDVECKRGQRKEAASQVEDYGEVSVYISNGPAIRLGLGCKSEETEILSDANPKVNTSIIVASERHTREAKVGTDDMLAGKDAPLLSFPRSQLSPRTADLLEALRRKLELTESERKVVAFGKAGLEGDRLRGGNSIGESLSGLYVVRKLPSPRPTIKASNPGKSRTKKSSSKDDITTKEYLCEECLTTMRLYEDEFQSVQNIVNKFEKMSHQP